jgi:hypothetical protein
VAHALLASLDDAPSCSPLAGPLGAPGWGGVGVPGPRGRPAQRTAPRKRTSAGELTPGTAPPRASSKRGDRAGRQAGERGVIARQRDPARSGASTEVAARGHPRSNPWSFCGPACGRGQGKPVFSSRVRRRSWYRHRLLCRWCAHQHGQPRARPGVHRLSLPDPRAGRLARRVQGPLLRPPRRLLHRWRGQPASGRVLRRELREPPVRSVRHPARSRRRLAAPWRELARGGCRRGLRRRRPLQEPGAPQPLQHLPAGDPRPRRWEQGVVHLDVLRLEVAGFWPDPGSCRVRRGRAGLTPAQRSRAALPRSLRLRRPDRGGAPRSATWHRSATRRCLATRSCRRCSTP